MSSGTVSITLLVPGVPDPIYKQQAEFGCSDINPYAPGFCPFKKNGKSHIALCGEGGGLGANLQTASGVWLQRHQQLWAWLLPLQEKL